MQQTWSLFLIKYTNILTYLNFQFYKIVMGCEKYIFLQRLKNKCILIQLLLENNSVIKYYDYFAFISNINL